MKLFEMIDAKRNLRLVAGKEVVLDANGFLKNPQTWSEELAQILAREAGLDPLTEGHWQVLRFIRAYYVQQGRAPLNHEIKSGTGFSMMDLESMFPGGIKDGARRLAGMPSPKGCGGVSV
ncbi:MAG: TusE/DsrC/DsvC family sulfur relay protein [Acidobacteriota bacterium]